MSLINQYSDLFNVDAFSSSEEPFLGLNVKNTTFSWKIVLLVFVFAVLVSLAFMYYKDVVKCGEYCIEQVFGINTQVVNSTNNTNSTSNTTHENADVTADTHNKYDTYDTHNTHNTHNTYNTYIDHTDLHNKNTNKEFLINQDNRVKHANDIPLEDIKYVSFLISKRNGMTTSKIGTLLFEIFTTQLPRTSRNFLAISKSNYYNDVPFHRVIKDFMIQGGDIINGDGTGSYNIYDSDRPFEDEAFLYNHTHSGLLSMANSGKDTNGCQFFITLAPCPHLDNKHVVFGRLVDQESYQVLNEIGNAETDNNDRPLNEYVIENTELHTKDYLVNQINEKTFNIANKINKLNEVSQLFQSSSTSSSTSSSDANGENEMENENENEFDDTFTTTIAELN